MKIRYKALNMTSLNQSVVLITGASSGIGEALALRLAQDYPGIRLVLTGRAREKLETLAQTCSTHKAETLVIAADLTESQQIETLINQTLAKFGRVDALVNNAGYGQMGPVELVTPAAAQRQFQVNVFAPMQLVRALIPVFRNQGNGRIVNISSIAGQLALPLGGWYSASKFALEALSDALRMELEPFNIQVSVIEPGPVTTNFFNVAADAASAAAPIEPNSPYQPVYEQMADIESRVNQMAWTADRVARIILQALTDTHPKPRYVAATGGDVMLFLLNSVLPTRWVDRFWQRFYGVNRMQWQSNDR